MIPIGEPRNPVLATVSQYRDLKGDTLDGMGEKRASKSLGPEARAAVRAEVRRIVDEDFAGNIKAAAKKLAVGYAQLWGIYEDKAGAGGKTIEKLADYTGKSFDALHGRAPAPA